MHSIDVSIIIPCYNEENIIEDSVNQICEIMDNTKFSYEIIFVDDKSKDRTVEKINRIIANRNMRAIFHDENEGRGKSVTDGIQIAKGDIVGFIDIDLEIHARYIPSLVLAIKNGADVATAWRIYKFKVSRLLRFIASKGYNFLVRNFLGVRLKDTETGLKLFNRNKLLPILEKIESKHWFWDTEIMSRCYFSKLKISEVPALYLPRTDKKSTVRLFRDSYDYFINLLKFHRRLSNEGLRRNRSL